MKTLSIIGNVGREPELKTLGQYEVETFSVAVTEKVKGENVTEWIRVSAFGKLSEIVEKFVHKGSKIYVSGNLNINRYTDKNGTDHTDIGITAEKIELLDSKKKEQQDDVPF